jgi:hypothetical protein
VAKPNTNASSSMMGAAPSLVISRIFTRITSDSNDKDRHCDRFLQEQSILRLSFGFF